MSFGTARPNGLDFVRLLSCWLAEDARFRESLPHYDRTDRYEAHLRDLGQALNEHAAAAEMAQRLRDWQRARVFSEGGQNFDLPRVGGPVRYRVRRLGVTLQRGAAGATLSTTTDETALEEREAAVTESVLAGDFTDSETLAAAWPDAGAGAVDALLKKLLEAGAIEPL